MRIRLQPRRVNHWISEQKANRSPVRFFALYVQLTHLSFVFHTTPNAIYVCHFYFFFKQ